MISSRWPRLRARGGTRVLPLLVMGWLALCVPGTVASQTPDLSQASLDYNAASDEFRSRTSAWDAQQRILQSAWESSRAAQRSGNRARIEAADAAAWQAAGESERLRRLVEEAEKNLTSSKRALESALQRSIDFASRQRPASATEGAALAQRIDGWASELQTLRALVISDPQRPALVYLPDIGLNIDPRMGLEAIRAQVDVLDRRIGEYRAEIDRVTQEIDNLTRSLRQQRASQDGAASLGRFGAGDPVGANRPRPAGESASPQLTLQQQIEQRTAYRNELENMYRQLDQRMASIRAQFPQLRGGLL